MSVRWLQLFPWRRFGLVAAASPFFFFFFSLVVFPKLILSIHFFFFYFLLLPVFSLLYFLSSSFFLLFLSLSAGVHLVHFPAWISAVAMTVLAPDLVDSSRFSGDSRQIQPSGRHGNPPSCLHFILTFSLFFFLFFSLFLFSFSFRSAFFLAICGVGLVAAAIVASVNSVAAALPPASVGLVAVAFSFFSFF